MRSLIYKNLRFLLIFITFIPMQAMEKKSLNTPLDQDRAITGCLTELINDHIDTIFSEKPTTVKDALIRIQSIARIIKTSHLYSGDAEITKDALIINGRIFPNHIHPIVPPIADHWSNIIENPATLNSLIISHEKSVEAINIILGTLHKKANNENVEMCYKVVNSLPPCVSEHIKSQFIAKHPSRKHNILYNSTGTIQLLHYNKDGLLIAAKPNKSRIDIGVVYKDFCHQYNGPLDRDFSSALHNSLGLLKARTLYDVSIEANLTPPSFEKN